MTHNDALTIDRVRKSVIKDFGYRFEDVLKRLPKLLLYNYYWSKLDTEMTVMFSKKEFIKYHVLGGKIPSGRRLITVESIAEYAVLETCAIELP